MVDGADKRDGPEGTGPEMKGLVLCGGRGTRLRPLTFTRAKQLIPVAGRPVLFYIIEDLARTGVRDIGVVVGPDTGPAIRAALGDGRHWGLRLTFLEQAEPLGPAHAVGLAADFVKNSPFVVQLGDCLLEHGLSQGLARYLALRPDALVLVAPTDDPGRFGVALTEPGGRVVEVAEKPRHPPSNLALVGVYVFGPSVFEALASLRPGPRGEYELTDAVGLLIAAGRRVLAATVAGWWKDTGTPEDLLEANRLLLERQAPAVAGQLVGSRVNGCNIVEAGARIVRSVIRGPVFVGAGAEVLDAQLGPYVSVGRGARVHGARVSDSVILDGARLQDVPWPVAGALIGREAAVEGGGDRPEPRRLRLLLADDSLVVL